ncbi:hypothetical protein Pint_17830 [Pistacia integerrima]|uniref:Uncharacterized protein n=1 Tax=Pistacia integerrima TaxID=434235 RepID=A0ACC0YUP3_9ROSI|nr:hypothetical protein Pint_17830 [Pistacia integerrima]
MRLIRIYLEAQPLGYVEARCLLEAPNQCEKDSDTHPRNGSDEAHVRQDNEVHEMGILDESHWSDKSDDDRDNKAGQGSGEDEGNEHDG